MGQTRPRVDYRRHHLPTDFRRRPRFNGCACDDRNSSARLGNFSTRLGVHRPTLCEILKLSDPQRPQTALKGMQKLIRKETEHSPGHSVVGGLAVYVLIGLIGLTVLTGMASSDDILFAGPLAPLLPEFLVNLASLTHPVLSKLVLISVLLHVQLSCGTTSC